MPTASTQPSCGQAANLTSVIDSAASFRSSSRQLSVCAQSDCEHHRRLAICANGRGCRAVQAIVFDMQPGAAPCFPAEAPWSQQPVGLWAESTGASSCGLGMQTHLQAGGLHNADAAGPLPLGPPGRADLLLHHGPVLGR